jgi:hypothetical protein
MTLLASRIKEELNNNRPCSQNLAVPDGSAMDPEMFELVEDTFSASSSTFRFDLGGKRRGLTLTDNLTACVIRCPAESGIIQIEFKQDSSGSRTIPTPTAVAFDGSTAVTVYWAGAAFMTESTTAYYRDVAVLRYDAANKTLREKSRNIGYNETP